MTVSTSLLEEAPAAPPPPAPSPAPIPCGPGPAVPGPRRATAVVVMGVGLVVVALAAATGVRAVGHRRGRPGPATTAAAPAPAVAEPALGPAADPSAITLSARDVSVVSQVYEPGQSSGWHLHPGIHAVVVLSGVLTVYDSQCHPETFDPGRPYVGGQQPHLAVNETGAPVVMSVTYLSPSTPAASSRHVPAPPGCIAGQS